MDEHQAPLVIAPENLPFKHSDHDPSLRGCQIAVFSSLVVFFENQEKWLKSQKMTANNIKKLEIYPPCDHGSKVYIWYKNK